MKATSHGGHSEFLQTLLSSVDIDSGARVDFVKQMLQWSVNAHLNTA